MSLADEAERVLTDVVLIRMVAYEHILGPYRPTRPLLHTWAQVWYFIRRIL